METEPRSLKDPQQKIYSKLQVLNIVANENLVYLSYRQESTPVDLVLPASISAGSFNQWERS